MSIRDLVLVMVVICVIPFILKRSYVGILAWSWVSYMNPHRLTWGFAYNMPFAQIVAITFFISLLFNRDLEKPKASLLLTVWVSLIVWMGVTTFFAFYPDRAWVMYTTVLKIQIFALFTIFLINNVSKLNQLLWVICMSIGYFSFKGGIFTVLTGGAFRVWGPAGSFIEENNALAVATLMVIPMMLYLARIVERPALRKLMHFIAFVSLLSALGSQSRGALISILAVGTFFWLKSHTKLITGILILVLGLLGYSFMPASWHERMDTIVNYQEDRSAMSRLNSWQYNINVANSNITGGGLKSESIQTFSIYAPNPNDYHSSHSIYFGVLGDHGWIGLCMFVFILLSTWRTLSKVIQRTKDSPELDKLNFLAKMMQISLIAYMSGGAFLTLAYFDLPWHLVAISIILSREVDKHYATQDQESSASVTATVGNHKLQHG